MRQTKFVAILLLALACLCSCKDTDADFNLSELYGHWMGKFPGKSSNSTNIIYLTLNEDRSGKFIYFGDVYDYAEFTYTASGDEIVCKGDYFEQTFQWSGSHLSTSDISLSKEKYSPNEDDRSEGIKFDGETYTVNGVSFKMIYVPGGTFQMGSTSGDKDEKPVHSVTLSGYWIAETEVKQGLWQAVMGKNPSVFKGYRLPVENVSWEDCQEFIRGLTLLTGKTFRLPTEAEWEYAARGGDASKNNTYSGSNTIDDVAWYESNSGATTHYVATKASNSLGLFDMSGNVFEWCQDCYGSYSSGSQTNPIGPAPQQGSSYVIRGGSWYYSAPNCRVTNRLYYLPSYKRSNLGLRLAL